MRKFIFFLLTFISLNASTPEELASFQGDSSAFIWGVVNAITGDFFFHQLDAQIQGAQPISIERLYLSREAKNPKLHWDPTLYMRATCILNGTMEFFITEPSGLTTQFTYRPTIFREKKTLVKTLTVPCELFPNQDQFAAGAVDLSHDAYGNTYNPRTSILSLTDKSHFVLKLSNGALRFYAISKTENFKHSSLLTFILEKEQLPNGNWIHYDWKKVNKGHILQKIATSNTNRTKTYAEINFDVSKEKISAIGSDQTTLSYRSTAKKLIANTFFFPLEKLYHKDRLAQKRTFPDGREVRIKYDKQGRVTKLLGPEKISCKIKYRPNRTTTIDNAGNKTRYTYDPTTLRLSKIETYKGATDLIKTEEFTWDQRGLLKTKKTPNLSIQYTHDQNGNIQSKTLTGILSKDTTSTESYTISYVYDELSRLIEEREDNGLKTSFTYLEKTNLPLVKKLSRKGIFLTRTSFSYNEDLILIEERTEDDQESHTKKYTPRSASPFINLPEILEEYVNDHLIKKTLLTYDSWGNISKKTIYDSKGIERYSLITEYNEKGQILKELDPYGHATLYEYDQNGNCIKKTDPLGSITITIYDKCNRPTIINENGYLTKHTYGIENKPQSTTNPLGNTTTFMYDPFENLLEKRTPTGKVTQFKYDLLGHCIEERHNEEPPKSITCNIYGSPLCITHPDKTQEIYTYNLDGTKKSYTDQKGQTTYYSYDIYGNLSCEIYKSSSGEVIGKKTWVYSAFHLLEETDLEGKTTYYRYNDLGQLQEKEYEGQIIEYKYDSLGHNTGEKIEDYLVLKNFDFLGREIEKREYSHDKLLTLAYYAYDPLGNLTRQTTFPNCKTEENGVETHIQYDCMGREIEKVLPTGAKITLSYEIDPIDHVMKTTECEPEGIRVITTTNSESELLFKEKQDALGKIIENCTYQYDMKGNCTLEAMDVYQNNQYIRTHQITRTYDYLNRLKSESENHEKTLFYTYTPKGQINTITKPNGIVLKYTYDNFGYQKSLTSSDGAIDYFYLHDKLGNLLSTTTTNRKIDARGNVTQEILYNGFTSSATYDTLNRRTSLTLPNGQTIFYTYLGTYLHTIEIDSLSHTYEYDLAGNIIQETHIDKTIAKYTYTPNSEPKTYTSPHFSQTLIYSPRSNITEIITNSATSHYCYDKNDHLIEEPQHNYTYDSLHNRTSKDHTPIDHNDLNQLNSCKYEPCGNLIQNGDITYIYDPLDRLIRVESPRSTTTYIYDTEHRRVLKDQNPYIWDQDHELGTFTTYRILGRTPYAEIGSAVAIIDQEEILVPIHDLLGNLIQAGSYHQFFTAFGEGMPLLPWGYSSKRHDPESGFVYFGRRYYDPNLGQFITPDPEGYADSINLYAYVLNNPLSNHDPYGLLTIDTRSSFPDSLQYRRFREPIDPNTLWHAFQGAWQGAVQFAMDTSLLYNYTMDRNPTWKEISQQWMQNAFHYDSSHPAYQRLSNITYFSTDITSTSFAPFIKIPKGINYINKTFKAAKTLPEIRSAMKATNASRRIFQSRKYNISSTPSKGYVENYFSQKTFQEMEMIFRKKFGFPNPGAPGGKSFFNSRSKRTFHLHYHKEHNLGKPHVDIRRRSVRGTKKYDLKIEGTNAEGS